jgi:hypothetical protein
MTKREMWSSNWPKTRTCTGHRRRRSHGMDSLIAITCIGVGVADAARPSPAIGT